MHQTSSTFQFSDGRRYKVERDPVINLFYCPRCSEAYKGMQRMIKHAKVCTGQASRSSSRASFTNSRNERVGYGRNTAQPEHSRRSNAYDAAPNRNIRDNFRRDANRQGAANDMDSRPPPPTTPPRRHATEPPRNSQNGQQPRVPPRDPVSDVIAAHGPMFLSRRFLLSTGSIQRTRADNLAGSSRPTQPRRTAPQPNSRTRRSTTLRLPTPPREPAPVAQPPPVSPVIPSSPPNPNTPWSMNTFLRSIINSAPMSGLAVALEDAGIRTADDLLIISNWDEDDRKWNELRDFVSQFYNFNNNRPGQSQTLAEIKPLHWWAFQKTVVRRRDELRRHATLRGERSMDVTAQPEPACPAARFLGRMGLQQQPHIELFREIGLDSDEALDFVCQLSNEDAVRFEEKFLKSRLSWYERMLLADGLKHRQRGKERAPA